MKKQAQLQTFFDKPWKHAVYAVGSFLLSYVTASWAIDTGKLQAYFLTLVLLVIGFQQIIQVIKKGNAR